MCSHPLESSESSGTARGYGTAFTDQHLPRGAILLSWGSGRAARPLRLALLTCVCLVEHRPDLTWLVMELVILSGAAGVNVEAAAVIQGIYFGFALSG